MFHSKQEFKTFLDKNKNSVIIILFTATWCTPCKKSKPIIHEHLKKHPEYIYIEIDYDEYNTFASIMKVRSIPSMFAYINGEKEHVCLNSSRLHIDDMFQKIES